MIVRFNLDGATLVGVLATLIINQSIVGGVLGDPLSIEALCGRDQLGALHPVLPLQFEKYR